MRCFSPRFDPRPFACAHDARDQVEGKDPLRACQVAVDVESDAQLQQQLFGCPLAPLQLAVLQRFDGLQQQARFASSRPVWFEHLIVKVVCKIFRKRHRSSPPLNNCALYFDRLAWCKVIQRSYWGHHIAAPVLARVRIEITRPSKRPRRYLDREIVRSKFMPANEFLCVKACDTGSFVSPERRIALLRNPHTHGH